MFHTVTHGKRIGAPINACHDRAALRRTQAPMAECNIQHKWAAVIFGELVLQDFHLSCTKH